MRTRRFVGRERRRSAICSQAIASSSGTRLPADSRQCDPALTASKVIAHSPTAAKKDEKDEKDDD
jgi:hypothetical protein